MPARKRIPPLPFRNFFAHEELVEFIEALAASRPDLCRLGSLGKSREGREVYLLTITDFASGSPDDRPGYLVHGNIHAGELSGTHTALYTARQLLADDAGSCSDRCSLVCPRAGTPQCGVNADRAESSAGGRISGLVMQECAAALLIGSKVGTWGCIGEPLAAVGDSFLAAAA